ncbi:hypothetical protein [Streptomyces sp. NBC_00847]|uniref:hypothetical protein n=1 Tax=Streptomyces sp. NBC_00847 TaxID=2975850 RepID=UPI0022519CD6|nr:hypothetical protein [Streptomyces sp. NBC_00847]MCX4884917.1 hypothetical protein [Streptomyces sp. NBC_00847]
MAVDQLPGRVREFANYLNGLLARLDQGGGWCAVFWQRDPDGMRACLEGREVPPWDVVEAVLQDLAAVAGPVAANQEKEQARGMHAAALAAYDARPGGRDDLGDRLDVMLREQRYAAERQAELGRQLAFAATRQEAETCRLDLAWACDDHDRATARCAELRSRMAELDRRETGARAAAVRRGRAGDGAVFRTESADAGFPRRQGQFGASATGAQQGAYDPTAAGAQQPGDSYGYDADGFSGAPGAAPSRADFDAVGPSAPAREHAAPAWTASERQAPTPEIAPWEPPVSEPPAPKQRKRRRGSARFAGMAEEAAAPVVVPTTAVPPVPAPAAAGGRTPRGARFAGGADEVQRPQEPKREPLDEAGVREVAGAVEGLVRLRAEGRSGEAHALLVEAAHWPAGRFPSLAEQLQRAGLAADWASLLWEAASLPAPRLVAAADALVAAGRGSDGEQILRQGVARPATEIGQAVLALAAQGRSREVRALLDAYVRVRTPEEAARSAEPDPQTLVPLLLGAAQGVSDERHWDLVHALRVAGFTA